jgi:uncharacterized protein (TIRG00374 family)
LNQKVSNRKKLSSATLQIVLGVVFAVGLLWLFFRGTDLDAIRQSLNRANPALILAAIAMTLVTHLWRALRWQVLLAPLGRAGLWNCFATTIIGFTVNFLVPPGRLGEIARPYLLARKENFSASGAFATIIIERILDLVTVVLLIGFWLLVAELPSSSEEVMFGLKTGGLIGLVAALGSLLGMFVLARDQARAKRWFERIFRILPAKLEAKATRFAETFTKGLAVLVDAASFIKAIMLSICVWVSIAATFWIGARALGVDYPFGDTFFIIGFLTVGVAVPTPGAVGGYHYMAALALTKLLGVDPSVASAVALVSHAIAYLPVTVIGIFLFPSSGGSFRQLKTISSET